MTNNLKERSRLLGGPRYQGLEEISLGPSLSLPRDRLYPQFSHLYTLDEKAISLPESQSASS